MMIHGRAKKMNNSFIDLRSDTVTKPTQRMREAMARAEVGDDVYGEDPTVNELQERAAGLLGKEAALFVPTGSMGNMLAVKCHTNMGEEVVIEASGHIYHFEMGAMSAISGTLPRVLPGKDGFFTVQQLKEAVRPHIYYLPRTTLLCLENTHNMAGGRCLSLDLSRDLCEAAKERGMKCHLDGARIFNAAIAMNTTAKKIAEPFDSVMFCISKGLSAPVGSLLAGSRAMIEDARRYRKMFGGGMRQAGVLAAAGLVAFEEVLPLLKDDHRRAKELAAAATLNKSLEVDIEKVETNIFMIAVKPPLTSERFASGLKEKGILISAVSSSAVRLVTHKDITDEDVLRAGQFIREFK
jgi:threonine aldolase